MSIIFKKIDDLKDELFSLSTKKERKQQNYLKAINASKSDELFNQLSGETYLMSYSVKKENEKKVRERQQQIYAIISYANTKKLKPIFYTLTVPSIYHPVNSIKQIKNSNFKFITLDEAIKKAYVKLKETNIKLYKRIKKYITKDILYIKVYEPHQSLIPHLHCMLFAPEEFIQNIKKVFEEIVKAEGLDRVDFDQSISNENVVNSTAYIMKYLFKTTLAENDYYARVLDGWRRKYQIRVLETSQLPLSLEVYRAIYYSLPKEEKERINEQIKDKGINYFQYFMENYNTPRKSNSFL